MTSSKLKIIISSVNYDTIAVFMIYSLFRVTWKMDFAYATHNENEIAHFLQKKKPLKLAEFVVLGTIKYIF